MMKYDLSKKPTRGAQRTLAAFSKTMFALLAKKPFESISVNEICELSNFPRATFYNYFDDKYDLLNYCWYLLSHQIAFQEQPTEVSPKILATLFDRTYYLLSAHSDLLSDILKNNPSNSFLINNFSMYLKHVIQNIFHEYLHFSNEAVPLELIVDHFSNTVMLILDAIFLKRQPITLEEAHVYLNFLLGHLLTEAPEKQ